MYKELVKRLREKAGAFDYDGRPDIACDYEQAADAIEKLSSAGSIYGKAWTLGYDAGRDENSPRWISVADRLPEESEGLRWGEEPTLRFTSVWCCDVNTGTIEVRNRLQGKKTGIECLDQYMKDTKWHWSQSWWEPTHWMPIVPLPEKPKE